MNPDKKQKGSESGEESEDEYDALSNAISQEEQPSILMDFIAQYTMKIEA